MSSIAKSTFQISLTFVIASCISFPAFSKVVVRELKQYTTVEFSIEDVSFEPIRIEGQDFSKAFIKGVDEKYIGVRYVVGQPEIPVIRLFVSGPRTIEVFVGGEIREEGEEDQATLVPVLTSIPKIPSARPSVVRDEEIYHRDGFIPETSYAIERLGTVRGTEKRLVTLHPLSYNPVTKERIIRQNFIVKFKTPTPETNSTSRLLFIVGEKFANSQTLEQYKRFKEKAGFKIESVVIRAENKTPEKIRKAVQDLFRASTVPLKYGIIVGDQEDVPAYNSKIIHGVTDHYYKAVDTDNYDTDIGTPDISIGRVSAASEEQLTTMLKKFIRYEEGQFATQDWLKKIAFIATDDKTHYDIAEETHNYAISNYTLPKNFLGNFPSVNQPGGDQLYAITHKATAQQVKDILAEGRVIINYSGHGATDCWQGPWLCQNEIEYALHNDALPFVISNACITGRFTTEEVWGETWSRHPRGAIMFLGSMDVTFWTEDDVLERKIWDGIFKEKKIRFAEITDYALTEHWRHFGGAGQSKYYWESYVMFGDPTIKLRLNPSLPRSAY